MQSAQVPVPPIPWRTVVEGGGFEVLAVIDACVHRRHATSGRQPHRVSSSTAIHSNIGTRMGCTLESGTDQVPVQLGARAAMDGKARRGRSIIGLGPRNLPCLPACARHRLGRQWQCDGSVRSRTNVTTTPRSTSHAMNHLCRRVQLAASRRGSWPGPAGGRAAEPATRLRTTRDGAVA